MVEIEKMNKTEVMAMMWQREQIIKREQQNLQVLMNRLTELEKEENNKEKAVDIKRTKKAE